MLYADISREQILKLLPKGGVFCEVGVFSGAFSKLIIDVVQPQEFHLVDIWKWIYYDWNNPPKEELENIAHFKVWMKGLVPDYDGGNPDPFLERFYAELQTLASTEKRSSLRVHRGLTHEVAATLPNKYFDFIYIDADHHYDAVLKDLVAYSEKLKDGGMIMGDDFLEDLSRRDGLYGTIYAVTTFLKRTDFRCLVITGPSASNYLLYRTMSPYIEGFLSNLLLSEAHVVEIADALLPRYVQKRVGTPTAQRFIPSFM